MRKFSHSLPTLTEVLVSALTFALGAGALWAIDPSPAFIDVVIVYYAVTLVLALAVSRRAGVGAVLAAPLAFAALGITDVIAPEYSPAGVLLRALALAALSGLALVALQRWLRAAAERRMPQQDLAAAGGSFQTLFDDSPLPVGVWDAETLRMLAVNRTAIVKYGYGESQFLAMRVPELCPPAGRAAAEELIRQNLAHDPFDRLQVRDLTHQLADGRLIEVVTTRNRIRFNGRDAILSIWEDTRERLDAERALINSEERNRLLVDEAADGIVLLDTDGNYVEVNPAFCALTGYRREEVVGGSYRLLAPDDVTNLAGAQTTLLNRGAWRSELQITRKDGQHVWVEEHGRRLSSGLMLAIVRDITQERASRDLMAARIRQEGTVAELGRKALAGMAPQALMDEAARAVTSALDVPYSAILELVPEDELLLRAGDGWAPGHVGVYRDPVGLASMTAATLRSDGPIIVDDLRTETRFTRRSILQAHGVVSGLTVVIDVAAGAWGVLGAYSSRHRSFTPEDAVFLQGVASVVAMGVQRARADEELRDNQLFMEKAQEIGQIGHYTFGWTLPGELVWSREMFHINGIEDRVAAPSIEDTYAMAHPDDRAAVEAAINAAFASGGRYSLDHRLIRPDGSVRWVHQEGQVISEGQAPLKVIGTLQDITERKRLEDQLVQAQKMDSIGRLAGGVAHDFNNMMTAVIGYSDLALMGLPDNNQLRADIQEVRDTADRAAKLAHQLLAFSRQQLVAPQVLDLNGMLASTDRMLQRIIGEDVELVSLPAADLGLVRADPHQLEQVLMNLAVNARDAMATGGKLTIETGNVELDESYTEEHADTPPGPYVMLSVSDTGEGISAAVRKHIFEPFFTTKEVGKGTGLGLATCYGIVTQAGGSISVYSEEGIGTTFKIYLPRVANAGEATAAGGIDPALPRGTETILLAEDEGAVRNLAARVLRDLGYRVREAPGGGVALSIAAAMTSERIDLLLTDVVMPQMGGKELADRIQALRPGIKVLFTSGYTDDAVIRHGVVENTISFLRKPFTPAELARSVREVLDRTQGEAS